MFTPTRLVKKYNFKPKIDIYRSTSTPWCSTLLVSQALWTFSFAK